MARHDLSEQQTSDALRGLVAGAEPAQMAAFLVLLRAKGETAEEIAGMAKAMRALGVPVHTGCDGAPWATPCRPGLPRACRLPTCPYSACSARHCRHRR